jgi:hypothetical protein
MESQWLRNLIPKNSEALINLLDRKGIITKLELLAEMKRVQASLVKAKT